MLARCGQAATRRGADFVVARVALVLLGQEFHCQPHAVEFGTRDVEHAGFFRTAREHHRVEILLQRGEADFDPDLARGAELDAFGLHLHRAAVDQVLFHFEVWDAVAQQASDPVALLEHGHRMARARELLGAGQTRGAAADDGHRLARAPLGHLRLDPAFFEAAIDNRAFDAFDRHRRIDDVECASRLAGSGTHAAGKFGEVVGRMQHVERILPVVLVDEVVPVRDDVVHRTAVVAIGNAAVHAARSLLAQLVLAQRNHEFLVMRQPFCGIAVGAILALVFEETRFLAHDPYSAASIAACSRSSSSALSARW